MNKVALLTRVSSTDQSHDRQVIELTEFAASRDYDVVAVVTETVSGAKRNIDRKDIQQIIKLAQAKSINKVLIHEVTRLGRDTAQVLDKLKTLHSLKVSVVEKNYTLETLNPDGSENPMAQFLFTILTDIGRMERLTLIERVKSSMAEAKRKGKHMGRPEDSTKDIVKQYPKVVKYLKFGQSIRETATICGVGISTIQRVKKAMQ